MMNTGTAGRASSSSSCGTALPAPLLLRSCCVSPSPTPGPAPLCSGRRWEVGCPGLALVAMPAGGAAACPLLDGAEAFPALPQSSPERMIHHPVPVGRAVVSPSEKDYQNVQLCFPFCLSQLYNAFWHCMKQLCPEAMISMDACFNGDSSLAQLHPTSPIYLPASTAALSTPQPISLQALSKAPATRQELGSQHGRGPSLCPMARAGPQPTSSGQGTSRCL